MRGWIGAVLVFAALAVSAAAASAATHHSCGSIGGEFLHIRTINTSCKVAKNSVIAHTMQGGAPPGWRCKSERASMENTVVTCKHAGDEVVAYTFHA